MTASSPASFKARTKRLLKTMGAAQARKFGYWIRNQFVYRGNARYCPICEHGSSHFATFGYPPRPGAECPWCLSKERHRFVWMFWLSDRSDLFAKTPGRRFLHLAPEIFFEPKLREMMGRGYVTADYYSPLTDVQMDIQDIQFKDGAFDIIYCSHVLEHVADDRKALSEFYRVLKTGGWAVLMVPDYVEKTIEDPTVTDPQERLRLFRQVDHVRLYGPDFADRAREAGFDVAIIRPNDILPREEIVRMGLREGADNIYFCRKSIDVPKSAPG